MNKIFLFFNTLKYLKWQQIYYRLLKKIIKPKIKESFTGTRPLRSNKWIHHDLYDEKIDDQLNAYFLNQSKKLDLPKDWNDESFSKLWVYNLHYFEDLLCYDSANKRNMHLKLLSRWADENPIGYGNGWEPYPLSLRIVNTLKAWLGGLELNNKICESTYNQASYLSNNLEKHLLGNHYFVNLKALLFAGVILDNSRWLSIAERGLLVEIPEQILEDGANFELSPMYHALILVDMLDIYNLSKAYPHKLCSRLVSLLDKYIPKMLAFMEAMTHPDGGVSFFNDSVDGIAPKKIVIESYAKMLGFKVMPNDYREAKIINNDDSGYFCALTHDAKLIFDTAAVGPDYIPGHAHADTLSFEMSINAQRVFVNSGISEYGLGPKRINQRKTFSHNTVEVDHKDSSQVWSGFRVANRAKVISKHAEIKHDNSIELTASHNGYKSLFFGCNHTRKLILRENSLMVSDSLEGTFRSARSLFYFHPDLKISFENNLLLIKGPKFVLYSDLEGKSAKLIDSFWHPEFGMEVSNKMLEIDFRESQINIEFMWSTN